MPCLGSLACQASLRNKRDEDGPYGTMDVNQCVNTIQHYCYCYWLTCSSLDGHYNRVTLKLCSPWGAMFRRISLYRISRCTTSSWVARISWLSLASTFEIALLVCDYAPCLRKFPPCLSASRRSGFRRSGWIGGARRCPPGGLYTGWVLYAGSGWNPCCML